MPVCMKHAYASAGVHTMGSSRRLNDVFTTIGQPVRASNASINARNGPWRSALTVCTRAE